MSCVEVPGKNISAMPACLSAGMSASGIVPPSNTGNVVHPLLLEQIHQLRRQRVVSSRKNGKPDDVDIFLNGGGCDHLGGLAKSGINDFHPSIAQRARNNLSPAVVPIKARLGNQHPYSFLRHFSVALCALCWSEDDQVERNLAHRAQRAQRNTGKSFVRNDFHGAES